ncbi:MAG: hypothetical protein WDO24_04855 [Pseudomonadota bacterium]
MRALYQALGEAPFEHDFENVVYDEAVEFDNRLATPGLHTVARQVRPNERATILPPDVFRRFEGDNFWCDAGVNRHGVTVI